MKNIFTGITPTFEMHNQSLAALQDNGSSASSVKLYTYLRYSTEKFPCRLSLNTINADTGLTHDAVASARTFLASCGEPKLITAVEHKGKGGGYTFSTPETRTEIAGRTKTTTYFSVPHALMLTNVFRGLSGSAIQLYLTALANVADDIGLTKWGRNAAILRVKKPGREVRLMTAAELIAESKLKRTAGRDAFQELIDGKFLQSVNGKLEVLHPVNGLPLDAVEPEDAEPWGYSIKGSKVWQNGKNLLTPENFTRYYEPYFENFDATKTQQNNLICPFDGGHDAFSYNHETGKWTCHACGISGGMREFQLNLDKLENTPDNLRTAMRRVCKTLGVVFLGERKGDSTHQFYYPLKDGSNYHRVNRYEKVPDNPAIPFRWNGKRFVKGLKGEPRILYNWPDVAKASVVFVTESHYGAKQLKEFCADNKIRDEFNAPVATTCANGANSWEPKFAEELLNKKIIILPDADIPGEKYWGDVSDSLEKVGNTSYVTVRFDPNVYEEGKVRHYLDTKPSAAEFLQYVKLNLSPEDAAKYVDSPWLTIESEPEYVEA